ncbi:biotin/lipoyl-binding carrier protein [Ruminococcus sp. OA3]|uniref:biotin/lipoyl-binding carrier protein n=1 Tax=Ruminococcus sp. OA3 TaxID=2914164 RepID=UPI001F0549AF|nr:biotin/lipoyl-binding carrier protein [Ruminococcus sp. OA3]MCH1983600.1 biotin/lipoyl-binding carrier protein [Ruminococcus sp. OA3]
MKSYTITVNGNVYEVTVEENTGGPAAAPKPTPAAAPKAPVSKPAAKPAGGSAGAVQVTASVPGKVFKVEASTGQSVKTGDTIVILEAMKMEIPVVAPQDGTIVSIDVAVGDTVESGDALASMD